jgi:hypothetical protein
MTHHVDWAESLQQNYKGLRQQEFGFWINFVNSLETYVDAVNRTTGREILSIPNKENWALSISGPILNVDFLVDSASREIFYAFTSERLAQLWKAKEVPSIRGAIQLSGEGNYPTLECNPPLILNHFGQKLNIGEVSNEIRHTWPIYDIAARCMIAMVLDAATFGASIS